MARQSEEKNLSMGIANAKEVELSDRQGHHPQAEAELPVWTGRKDWTCMSMWRRWQVEMGPFFCLYADPVVFKQSASPD